MLPDNDIYSLLNQKVVHNNDLEADSGTGLPVFEAAIGAQDRFPNITDWVCIHDVCVRLMQSFLNSRKFIGLHHCNDQLHIVSLQAARFLWLFTRTWSMPASFLEIADLDERRPKFNGGFDDADNVIYDPEQIQMEEIRLEIIEKALFRFSANKSPHRPILAFQITSRTMKKSWER